MTVVVDIGCHDHPDHEGESQDSVARLIERYKPTHLYGFDPHPGTPNETTVIGDTLIRTAREAAWTREGLTGYTPDGLGSRTHATTREELLVPCFDLAAWLSILPVPVVLKCDIEGGEYDLLEHLLATGAISRVSDLLVEWHPAPDWKRRKAAILARVTCPVSEWM